MTDHQHFEERIQLASQTGNWDQETLDHVEGCATCAEQVEVSRFMNALADARLAAAPPDPQVVKLKAQIVNREKLDEHTAHRISNVQRVIWGLIGAGWLIVIVWNRAQLSSWVSDFDIARIVVSSVTGEERGSLGLLLALITLASVTAMVAVHAIFSEE